MKNSFKDDATQLKSTHTPAAVSKRLRAGFQHSYLRDFIYGAIDGAVTTFAVVSGVAGANLSINVIVILGIANLIADGFSMAVSNFLGTRAEEELRQKARRSEEEHIRKIPDGEREEIRQIFAVKGFKGAELERAVKIITSNPDQWVNTMLQEELGFALEGPSPFKAGLSTFISFVIVGSLPLLAFLFQLIFPQIQFNPFLVSTMITAVAFFGIGALKAPFVEHRWYSSGLETLLVGGGAAILAYAVGVLLKGVVG